MNWKKRLKLNMKQIKCFKSPGYPRFLVVMLAGLVLAGCAGMGPAGTDGITRAVKLVGPQQGLLVRAQNTLNNVPGIDVVPEDSFADLTLILREGTSASKGLFNTTPPIVGILRQQQEPTYLRLSYTLLDQEGSTLATGEVVGVGQDKTGYFPSLEPEQADATRAEALNDSLKQLKKELAEDVRQSPFIAKVSTQIAANNQVAIPVYQQAGLGPRHRFTVEGQPETELRFVGLTQGIGGAQTHALLEVTRGQMPELGAKVILE